MKNYVSELRKANGLTQQQLADMIGASLGAVQKWESKTNNSDMAGTTLMRLCHALNVTPEEIYGLEPFKPAGQSKAEEEIEVSPYQYMEDELVRIFRGLTLEGKNALIASAQGIAAAFSVKNNQNSGDSGEERIALYA